MPAPTLLPASLRSRGWTETDTGLMRTVSCSDFSEAFAYAVRVALLAERLDHHPEITISYGRLVISGLATHDAGGIVTERDIALAMRAEEIFS